MHKVYDFTGLARIGYQQHHIIGLKHAQVAVLGLGRMQIHGGIPVDEKVVAIFMAICPALPMPEVTSLPPRR